MRPDQIAQIRQPSDPRLHPDRRQVVFAVQQMDLEDDWYLSQIWRWDGESAAPFTTGKADKAPRWSPDGSQLAFLRAPDPNTPFQVAVMPTGGGEPRVVSDFALGATELEWSPDGRWLAVVAKTWSPEYAELGEEERERRPRRVNQLPFRWDNLGWTHDRGTHIWLVDPSGSESARCLTSGEFDEAGIVWSPGGHEIAFLSARHAAYGLEAGVQAFTVDISGGEPLARSDVASWENLSYDAAGRLHATGIPDHWGYPATLGVYRLDPEGPVELTVGFDRNLAVPTPATAPAAPQWLPDGSARVLIEDEGSVTVGVLTADGSVSELIGGRRAITGAGFSATGDSAAFIASTTTNPGELWWWEADGTERRLTDLNGALAADMVEPTRFTIDHEGISVEGWVYLPPGTGQVPVLLNIHGGPATQYGWSFFDEFQVYVGAGYGVVATNPRGSSGYGQDHVRAVLGQWQTDDPPDMRDLSAAVAAAAAAEPRLDTKNVGVMGGSYGGLATVRLIASDQRYKSAVAERGLYVFNSFVGTSDIGPWFPRLYLHDEVLDSVETMWAASSMKGFAEITTPTLIVHSEADFRCPIEQAEQLFVAMLRNGTPVEMLRFPSPASHELSRSGKPRHRVDRFDAIVDWHDRWMK